MKKTVSGSAPFFFGEIPPGSLTCLFFMSFSSAGTLYLFKLRVNYPLFADFYELTPPVKAIFKVFS
jgi:hypothetical protein